MFLFLSVLLFAPFQSQELQIDGLRLSHIDFHVEAGLTATIIESPNLLQETLTIPADHLAVCHQDGQATIGNAAGNSKNYMDMDGQPLVPARYDCG